MGIRDTAGKIGEKVLDELGAGIGGSLGRAIFVDQKFPAPVTPPDLHLVKPAAVDAEGRVDCIYCKQKIAFATANLIGSEGFSCPRCIAAATRPVVALPDDVRIKRGPWPYLIALGTVGAVVGIIVVAMH